jgi:hypothetical protein
VHEIVILGIVLVVIGICAENIRFSLYRSDEMNNLLSKCYLVLPACGCLLISFNSGTIFFELSGYLLSVYVIFLSIGLFMISFLIAQKINLIIKPLGQKNNKGI